MQIPDHESINETLQTAKKLLQQNNLEEAKDCLTQILESQPAHREALYYSAVAERQQKNVSAANEAIARLLTTQLFGQKQTILMNQATSRQQLLRQASQCLCLLHSLNRRVSITAGIQ